MATILDKKMELWKKKLLDLGMRNRLLNYRDTKRATLNITSPSLEELYRLLVVNEKELALPRVELKSILSEDNEERLEPTEIPGDIRTDRSGKDTMLVAKNLKDKARTANEEQGVNILYASFGFLEWKESPSSSNTIKSPIILVPVVLSQESITDPYTLSLHEDEVLVNPTLVYKLENDGYGALPDFDPQDSIHKYLESLNTKVSRLGWKIDMSVSISLLSFLKINMYKDLDRRSDVIAKNSIIRAIAGYKTDTAYDFSEMNDYDHDAKETVFDTFQVIDADSSQQDAITMSKKGASFVLQGPPGTGKSQTITNIIAEGLADGKKILFVSEKMAALDVVYNRLDQANLSDFCLVLHSHKANKRELLDSLRKVLDLKNIRVNDDALQKLKSLDTTRLTLDKYGAELLQPIMPLGQSVYDANGILSGLASVPDMDFDLSQVNIGKVSKNQLFDIEQAITDFARTLNNMSDGYEGNVWKGTTVDSLTHEKRNELLALFDKTINAVDVFRDSYDPFCVQLGLSDDIPIASFKDYAKMLHYSATSKGFPAKWIYSFNKADLLGSVGKASEMAEGIRTLRKKLGDDYERVIFDVKASDVISTIGGEYERFNRTLSTDLSLNEFLGNLNDYRTIVENYYELTNMVGNAFLNMQKQVTVEQLSDFKDVEELYEFVNAFNADIRPSDSWFDIDWRNQFTRTQILNSAERMLDDLKKQKEKLLSDYDSGILDIEYSEILRRCRTDYTSSLRMIKSQYRSDCKLIRSYRRIPVKSIKYEELLAVTEDVKLYHDYENKIKENSEAFSQFFGGWFDGSDTDVDCITRAWNNFSKILKFYDYAIPDDVKRILLDRSNGGLFAYEESVLNDYIKGSKVPAFDELTGIDKNSEILLDHLDRAKKMIDSLTGADDALAIIRSYSRSEKTNNDYYDDASSLYKYQQLISQFNEDEEEYRSLFETLYTGENTEWNNIIERIEWVDRFLQYRSEYGLSDEFCEGIASDNTYAALSEDLALFIDKYEKKNRKAYHKIDELFEYELLDQTPKEIRSFALTCSERINDLESWIDFARAKEKCQQYGLTSLIDIALETGISSDQICNVFKKRFERLWIDYAMTKLPEVESFRTRRQEELINEFKRLDVEQFRIAQLRIRERLLKKIPDSNSFTSANDELGILKHELNKQRRIMPVRKLFDRIPNLLPCLKPCLMMSPLSVSQYLQTENYLFDMVIFDEASQVRTENAIGAISRAKQVIIAGDIHQLPPTSFFSASISGGDDYDEDYDDPDGYESVLDESNTVLPQLTLRWHYRSRDESLIAFSNSMIYNNSLITFPSPKIGPDSDGVEFIYVEDGLYDRSRRRNNPIEAKRVVDTVFDSFRKYPKRSVGVITFSEAQQQCVEDEVLRRRLADPSFEEFFNQNVDEPFFIKNLENVQGDERDTIIFSVGYAKTSPADEVKMNFGPLNREGGYRRLNVAVTRAKYNVKLVCSFLPNELRITDATPKGVKLLKAYIDYAQNGYPVLEKEINVSDQIRTESRFEESVYEYLIGKGYDVNTQIGCSGYRIDLGIRHPVKHGLFVLGVECDGAAYHSSRTARERDRLRQSVLESMGWTFYRIWSTDWIKDPVSEGAKLVKAIEDAIWRADHPESIVSEATCTDDDDSDYFEETVREKEEYGFAYYQEFDYPRRTVYEATIPQIAVAVDQIVKAQSPIHYYYVCRQIAPLLCNAKVTSKIVDKLDNVVSLCGGKNRWKRKGDYLWDLTNKTATPKVPVPDTPPLRDIEKIAPEELCEAMLVIISKSYGIDQQSLYKVVTLAYGFLRCTSVMEKQLEIAYRLLLDSKKVKCIDGKLSLADK